MGYEVEIKFRVADHEVLANRLAALGAEAGRPSSQSDLYFAHPLRDFARTDEALRLRRDGASNQITYKGPKQPGPTKTREEIEVPLAAGIDARADLARLLARLGFEPRVEVAKTRQSFALERGGRAVSVSLDDAGEMGTFAEIEALARDEADLAEAQAAVLGLAEELGLSRVEPRSYLRMTLERGET